MSKFTCSLACLVALCLSKVHSNFKPEVRAVILERVSPVVAYCAKEHGVTYDQLQAAQVTGREVQDLDACFIGCMARETGLTSCDGVYNTDTALDILKGLVGDEFPVYKEKARKCGYVNNQTYCDGPCGCEIAKAIFICYRLVDVKIVLTELPKPEPY